MHIKSLVLSSFMTNCYLVYNEETKQVIIVDPASSTGRISEKIQELDLEPVAILLTHGHGDHIGAVNDLKELYKIKVYAHKEELDVLEDPEVNLSIMLGDCISVYPDVLFEDSQILNIAGFDIKVIHTPGHTKGSSCFLFENEGVLISGDTMFYGSYGRTDFPTGSTSQLMRSIREKLLVLDPKTVVYSGHGTETTIGDEKKWY